MKTDKKHFYLVDIVSHKNVNYYRFIELYENFIQLKYNNYRFLLSMFIFIL